MCKKLKPLEPSDAHHLKAAEGWVGLGDLVSANDELEEISPEARAHPAVLFVRYEIYSKAEKWDMATEVSNALTKLLPEEAAVWICFAYSTRRKTGGGIPQAKEILLESEPKFPREYRFPFNLACYFSQLHQFEEAEKWIKKAMLIDEKIVQRLAIDDPDLLPLWDSMGGTLWKRE
jgi:tetratricopeptide (TPR) repeat protein